MIDEGRYIVSVEALNRLLKTRAWSKDMLAQEADIDKRTIKRIYEGILAILDAVLTSQLYRDDDPPHIGHFAPYMVLHGFTSLTAISVDRAISGVGCQHIYDHPGTGAVAIVINKLLYLSRYWVHSAKAKFSRSVNIPRATHATQNDV